MNPLQMILAGLLLLGFILLYVPKFQTAVVFHVAVFVILLLYLLGKLTA